MKLIFKCWWPLFFNIAAQVVMVTTIFTYTTNSRRAAAAAGYALIDAFLAWVGLRQFRALRVFETIRGRR